MSDKSPDEIYQEIKISSDEFFSKHCLEITIKWYPRNASQRGAAAAVAVEHSVYEDMITREHRISLGFWCSVCLFVFGDWKSPHKQQIDAFIILALAFCVVQLIVAVYRRTTFENTYTKRITRRWIVKRNA
jgi:hypothetical protein